MPAVLRAQDLSGAKPFSLRDARVEADKVLAEARAEAERLVAEARAEAGRLQASAASEAAALKAAAQAEGRSAGEEAGRKAGEAAAQAVFQDRFQAELAQARTAIEAVAVALKDAPASFARAAEAHVVALAVEMAELLVRRELTADPALVASAARAALETLAASGKVALRVNPEDRALLAARLPELARGITDSGRLELVEDATVARGGCVAAAEGAEADATVAARIAELRRLLLGEEGK